MFGIKARANMFESLLGRLDDIFKPLIENMYDIMIENGADYSKYSLKDKKV